jgi:hypothetical protein
MWPSLFRVLLITLAAAAVVRAEPQVLILPPRAIFYNGAPHRLRAAVLEPPEDKTLVWSLDPTGGGTIDPATGEFQASAKEVAAKGVYRVTVHAALRSDPRIRDTIILQVIDPGIEKSLGPEAMALLSDHAPDWIEPWLKGLPFNEPESGKLPPTAKPFVEVRDEPLVFLGPDGQTLAVPAGGMPVAYGSSLTLQVPQGPAGTRTVVSFGTPGVTWETLNVTGLKKFPIPIKRRFTKIRLQTSSPAGEGGGFRTVRQEADVRVMGFLPFAGQPKALGDQDGTGLAARFRAPGGIALVQAEGEPWAAVVSDVGAHVVRRVTSRGRVTTLAGLAGTPGSADGPAVEARFFAPTFLAVATAPGGRERIYVADTGNNTIRLIQDGLVSTYAGQADTPAGYRDAPDARTARFDRPLGLALDPDGNLYVVDAGNAVIRRIDAQPPHAVTTLAGGVHQRGAVDGRLRDCRFWAPKGLCRRGSELFLTDGHSVRVISLNSGQVVTLAGNTHTAGYHNGYTEIKAGQAPAPALNAPWDIQAWTGAGLLVADTGNHAIRLVGIAGIDRKRFTTLGTLAGDPRIPSSRYGSARVGTPPPPDLLQKGFAGFRAPCAVLALPGSTPTDLSMLVADETALSLGSNLYCRTDGREPALRVSPDSITLGEDLSISFAFATGSKGAPPAPPLALRWSLDVRGALGRTKLAGGFAQPGDEVRELRVRPKVAGVLELSLYVVAEDGFVRVRQHRIEVKENQAFEGEDAGASENLPAPALKAPPTAPEGLPATPASAQGNAERKDVPGTSRSRKPKKKEMTAIAAERKVEPKVERKVEREVEAAPAAMEPTLPAPVPDEDPRPFQLVEVRNPGRKNLSLQNFNLGAVARAHITELHVRGDQRFKSQFLAAYATADALRSFLAEALRHRISETPVADSDRTEFLCRMDEPVGTVTYLDGRTAPTRNLLVVARWDNRWEVITAYPVP